MAEGDGIKHGRDLVAIVLAVGLALAVNLLMAAVLYDALRSDTPGLSENATQVVLAAFTGITGMLGAYLGGRAVEGALGRRRDSHQAPTNGDTPPAPTPRSDTPVDE